MATAKSLGASTTNVPTAVVVRRYFGNIKKHVAERLPSFPIHAGSLYQTAREIKLTAPL